MTEVVSLVSRAEKFWALVEKTEGCWIWKGKKNPRHAYGQFYVGWDGTRYSDMRAHRVAWALANGGTIPADSHVLHTCDNPLCVNPSHLVLGSKSDNMKDAAAKGRHFWQKAVAMYRKVDGLFTREDVTRLRRSTMEGVDFAFTKEITEHYAWLESLAARIEALLPPEDTE